MTDYGVVKEEDRWFLEDGVAWVLTKNLVEVCGADTDTYAPSLRFHDDGSFTTTGRREDEAWRQLYSAMIDGSVRTYTQNQKDPQEWGVVDPKLLKNMKWYATEDYVTLRKLQPPKEGVSDIMRPLKLSAKDLIEKFPESDGGLDLTSEDYEPGLIRPEGDGQMTLSDAALWAATEGGMKRIVLGKAESWGGPVKALTDAISSGKIKATGRHNGEAPQVVIDGVVFGGLLVQYPHVMPADLSFALREVTFLKLCGPQLPEDEWHAGDTDKIIVARTKRDTPLYTHILIEKADVATVFNQFSQAALKSNASLYQCQEWLEAEMRKSLAAMPSGRARPDYLADARARFQISDTSFDVIWKQALLKTGAGWAKRGRKAKPNKEQ